MTRCGSKNVILTSKSEKKTKARKSAWWRPTLRVARAVPRVIIYIPLLVFFAFLCDKGCAESVRPAKNHSPDLKELVETGQLPQNQHHHHHQHHSSQHHSKPIEEEKKPPEADGDVDGGSNNADGDKERMQADSPFSREAFEKGMAASSRARAFEKSSQYSPMAALSHVMMPPPTITQPNMYSKVARVQSRSEAEENVAMQYNRHPFIQIYSSYQRSNLLLELSDGTVRTTRDTRDKRTLFQLSWSVYHGANRLENIHTCLFLCMDKNGKIYSTSHPSHDKNCFFRTSFPGQKSLAMLDAVISKAHSNVTHSMSLAVYKPKHKRPIGERVQVGKEGRQHQFLFDPINYDELRHVYSSDEIAELYRPFRRYTEHCPAVLAEWRKRQRKGGKHHRNRKGHRKGRKGKNKARGGNNGEDPRRTRDCSSLRSRCGLSDHSGSSASPAGIGNRSVHGKRVRRSDTKLCRRAKRQRCRAALSSAHPLYAPERVTEMCRARKWLKRCVRKAVRKAEKAGQAGQAAGEMGKAERERAKAAESGRCKARLEKRVRSERRRRLRAEGDNDVVKSDLRKSMLPRDIRFLL